MHFQHWLFLFGLLMLLEGALAVLLPFFWFLPVVIVAWFVNLFLLGRIEATAHEVADKA